MKGYLAIVCCLYLSAFLNELVDMLVIDIGRKKYILFLRLLYWYKLPIILFHPLLTRHFIKFSFFFFSCDWREVDQPSHPHFFFCMLFHHQHTFSLLESQAEMIPHVIFHLVFKSNTYLLLNLAKFLTPATFCFNKLSYLQAFHTTFQPI